MADIKYMKTAVSSEKAVTDILTKEKPVIGVKCLGVNVGEHGMEVLGFYLPLILTNILSLISDKKVTCLLIGYTTWLSQSEVAFLSNSKILGSKTGW